MMWTAVDELRAAGHALLCPLTALVELVVGSRSMHQWCQQNSWAWVAI